MSSSECIEQLPQTIRVEDVELTLAPSEAYTVACEARNTIVEGINALSKVHSETEQTRNSCS